ncbi:glycoside hydrolase family 95 protein [Hymenobacter norwichensis]|uniref:glycoside hydrolase family 95 protein n=1 Tax=Hymenobacter norwichensis TaxID=223903 RepID=UPI0003B3D65B|nr:glycoside hydrolase family 95 protein [Hymenobacter norwichensis]
MLLFWLLVAAVPAAAGKPTPTPLKLWYNQPATNWNEALPIGNGRLGAMVFGGPGRERLQLNEETVWAGEPGNNVVPGVYEGIQEIRKLLFAGKYQEAQDLSNKTFPRQAASNNNYGMPYQTLGNLLLTFPGHEAATNYYRDLDIEQAVAKVSYQVKGVTYTREIFASLPDQVLVVRLTASKPGRITCRLGLNSPQLNHRVQTEPTKLVLAGVSGSTDNKVGKVRFQAHVVPKVEGGSVTATDSTLQITGANAATVYISIGTNFKSYKDLGGDEATKAASYLPAALAKAYPKAKAEHVAYYRRYFDRVSLNLGGTDAVQKPTNARLAAFATSQDPALAELYFQYGRYLLISSSQPGTQAANLQGKWNDKLAPPWDSKYTVNINTEMNYWPAEVTNLSELHQPLFSMLKDLAETGKESAAVVYHARGWNMHHNTDLWRITGNVDGGFYGMWPMGGAWLTQHLWQHYLFTGDQAFLREYYPVLKGAALFYVDALQEEPSHKWLVVAPSMSPENSYQSGVGITAGTTMDNQLVFDVFSNALRAAAILNTDQAFADTLSTMIKRLPPMQIGQHGQLQEWLQDWDNPKSTHRHISHLYGLFPSGQISPYRTPELFEAARVTLTQRGDISTGWSMGWKVNFWARMLDGNHAYKLLSNQLRLISGDVVKVNEATGGGTYPNLLDAHPPFQIDGNFGCTAGLAELFMQSYDGVIDLLPALPDAWPTGEVKGLVARGGYVVDLAWDKGKVTRVQITSRLGGNCRVRVHSPLKVAGNSLTVAQGENSNPFYQVMPVKLPLVSEKSNARKPTLPPSFVYDLPTQAGKVYALRAQ